MKYLIWSTAALFLLIGMVIMTTRKPLEESWGTWECESDCKVVGDNIECHCHPVSAPR